MSSAEQQEQERSADGQRYMQDVYALGELLYSLAGVRKAIGEDRWGMIDTHEAHAYRDRFGLVTETTDTEGTIPALVTIAVRKLDTVLEVRREVLESLDGELPRDSHDAHFGSRRILRFTPDGLSTGMFEQRQEKQQYGTWWDHSRTQFMGLEASSKTMVYRERKMLLERLLGFVEASQIQRAPVLFPDTRTVGQIIESGLGKIIERMPLESLRPRLDVTVSGTVYSQNTAWWVPHSEVSWIDVQPARHGVVLEQGKVSLPLADFYPNLAIAHEKLLTKAPPEENEEFLAIVEQAVIQEYNRTVEYLGRTDAQTMRRNVVTNARNLVRTQGSLRQGFINELELDTQSLNFRVHGVKRTTGGTPVQVYLPSMPVSAVELAMLTTLAWCE